MRMLCIGGPKAGLLITTDLPVISLPIYPEMLISPMQEIPEAISYTTAVYHREVLRTPQQEFYFLRYEHQSLEETFSILFNTYAEANA